MLLGFVHLFTICLVYKSSLFCIWLLFMNHECSVPFFWLSACRHVVDML
jgi:hypothetical protein